MDMDIQLLSNPDMRDPIPAFSTVVYLGCTAMASKFIASDKARMRLPLPKKAANRSGKRKATGSDDEGEPAKQKPKKKRTSKASDRKKKSTKESASEKKPASKQKKDPKPKPEAEVIDLLDESEDEDIVAVAPQAPTRKRAVRKPTETPFVHEEDEDVDDDSEFEFEG